MQCGLLGKKLGHSYSPQIHSHLGNYSYGLFEVQPEDLSQFLHQGEFTGLNVTIPYKKDVLPYCDELTPSAKAIGAVNTIIKRNDGTLLGHNSDYYGFRSMLAKSGLSVSKKKVLVLGSGGASATVVTVLKELGANTIVISRGGENNYTNLNKHVDAKVIVNTTPVGMYPNNGESPLDLNAFPLLEGVLDLVYNPARTKLLMDAQHLGLKTENGLWMLVAQAKESAEYFLGRSIDDGKIEQIHDILQKQMENIVLIGMPGSGKSTIGKALSYKTGKVFVDADLEIVNDAGKSIPEIFAEDGEAVFRSLETKILSQLGMQSGLIIATGGGCVTKEKNYPLLHQNGKIIWIQRDINQLPTDGRPLSQSKKLAEMYQARKPKYEAFADYTVKNDSSIDSIVEKIFKEEYL